MNRQCNTYSQNTLNAIFVGSSSSDEGNACGFPDSKAQREHFAEHSVFHSSSSDEGNACGFSDSKAQRERFAEYYDFSTTNTTIRDEETGFGYFGARYYDSELLTGWMSVDPMSDKYPSINPYVYCAWNPIKLVDPDGRKIWIESGDGTKVEYQANMDPSGDDASQTQIQSLNEMYSTDLGEELLGVLIESKNDYYITNESSTKPNTCGTVKEGNGAKLKMGGNNDVFYLSHELFHAYQYECGQGGATYKNEVEAYLFSISLATPLRGGSFSPLYSRNPNTPDGILYEKATNNLMSGNTFSLTDFETAVKLFQSQSIANADGTYNASYYSIGDARSNPLLPSFYPLIR